MPALICDICGGNLKMSKGKIAVCESCGMEHSFERVQEKVQEIKGIVHVDNAHLIDNFFSLANDAFEAENYSEAERYCNKIIENDPERLEAYLLKGKAIGQQSNLFNFRFKEVAICFANTMKFALEDDFDVYFDEISNQFKELATSLCKVQLGHFSKWADSEDIDGLCKGIKEMKDAVEYFTIKTGIYLNKTDIFSSFILSIYNTIGIIDANTILLDYYSDRSRTAYNIFVEKTKQCVRILVETIALCDNNDELKVKLYELIATMLQRALDNNATDYIQNRWGTYTEQSRLSKSEKMEMESIIQKCLLNNI